MINFLANCCCVSEESSKLCISTIPSLICLFTSVVIASCSIGEYSRILKEDQENNTLISVFVFLGVTGILSGIFSFSNCLQIVFQLPTASVCIKIQKFWQTGVIFVYIPGILFENIAVQDGQNAERIKSQLIKVEIVLAILIVFTVFMHIAC